MGHRGHARSKHIHRKLRQTDTRKKTDRLTKRNGKHRLKYSVNKLNTSEQGEKEGKRHRQEVVASGMVHALAHQAPYTYHHCSRI